jgi:hypothetical protein
MAVAPKRASHPSGLGSREGGLALLRVIDRIREIPSVNNVTFTLDTDTVHLWVTMDGDSEGHLSENIDQLYAIEYEFRQSDEPLEIETHALSADQSIPAAAN